jgi:L-threonylcarbamoyladenylate synthase
MKFITFNERELLKKELDNDKVIAFPTETVFGLGANALSINAFENLVKVKNRRPDKPFTLMCASIDSIKDFIYINELAQKLIDKFMPGSITLLLKAKEGIDYHLHLNSEYVGIRIPNEENLLNFLKYYKKPLLVPSANKSDDIPARDHNKVLEYFKGEIDYCVEGFCLSNSPSTIIKITDNYFEIVTEGPISKQEIE